MAIKKPKASPLATVSRSKNTITANGGIVALDVYGESVFDVQITGDAVGTFQFEGSIDGVNYVAIPVVPISGGSNATSTTANGIWRGNASGLNNVRLRASAFTSGTATVVLQSAPAGTTGGPGTTTAISAPNATVAGAIGANGASVVAPVGGYATWSLVVSGTWVGTIAFQGSVDGGVTYPLNLSAHVMGNTANTTAQSTTANGQWDGGSAPLTHIRAIATAWSSGSAAITFNLSQAELFMTMLSALPAGANLIGNISQAAAQSVSGTLQSAAGATGNGTPLSVLGMSSVIFTVSGTFVGTVTFEGTEDGTIWSALSTTVVGGSTIGNTATAPGLYEASITGLQSIRARVSAWTSGTITVTAHALPIAFNTRFTSTSLNTLIAGEDQTNNVLKVEERFSPITPITTATTTTIKNGAGFCHNLRVAGGTLGNVTVYDNTAGSGTVLFPTITPIAGQLLIEDVTFAIGLTVVTAAATAIVGSVR